MRMNEDPVRDILRALAEEDAGIEASPQIEVRLRKNFNSWKRRRIIRRTSPWVLTAASIVLVFAFANRKETQPPATQSARVEQTVASLPEPIAPIKPLPQTTRSRSSTAAGMPESFEIVTEFFPLMDPAPPFERGQLLRVELPASAMQMVGLPVREEYLARPIHADVLVGEEGLPRAIRFVKIEKE